MRMKIFPLSLLFFTFLLLLTTLTSSAEISIEVIEESDGGPADAKIERKDSISKPSSTTTIATTTSKDNDKKDVSTSPPEETVKKDHHRHLHHHHHSKRFGDMQQQAQSSSPDSFSSIASILQSDMSTYGFPRFVSPQMTGDNNFMMPQFAASNVLPSAQGDRVPSPSVVASHSASSPSLSESSASSSSGDDESRSRKSFFLTGLHLPTSSIFRLRRKKILHSGNKKKQGRSIFRSLIGTAGPAVVASESAPVASVVPSSSNSAPHQVFEPAIIDSSSFASAVAAASSPVGAVVSQHSPIGDLGLSASFPTAAIGGVQNLAHPVFIPLASSETASVVPAPSSSPAVSPSAVPSSWTNGKHFFLLKKFVPKVPRKLPRIVRLPQKSLKALRGKHVKTLKKPKLISPIILFSTSSPFSKIPLRFLRFYGRKGRPPKQYVIPGGNKQKLVLQNYAQNYAGKAKPFTMHDIETLSVIESEGKFLTHGKGQQASAIGGESQKDSYKPESHLFEGVDPDDYQYPKDGEPILPSVPPSDTGYGQIIEAGASSTGGEQQEKGHKINTHQLKDQLKQFEKLLPEGMKQQLAQQFVEGKLQIPPAFANIAASLSPDQIQSLASAFSLTQGDNLKSQADKLQDLAGSSSPSESQAIPTIREIPFRNVHGAQHFFNQGVRGAHPRLRPIAPRPPRPQFDELSVFGTENEPIRLPRPQVGRPHGHRKPGNAPRQPSAPVQFIPLDGRPSGSPHIDQIEHLLASALNEGPKAHPSGHLIQERPSVIASEPIGIFRPGQPPVHHQIIHLNGHETPANGQYNIVPVALPSAGLVFPPGFVPQPFLSPVAPEQMLRGSPQQGRPRAPQVPKVKSTYSNGWIPKDLPTDWNPGQIGTTPGILNNEYAISMFTAADSVTPSPGNVSSDRPGITLSHLKPVTTTPSPQEFREPTAPSKPTSPIQTGKQELIKLWLSQTPQIGDAISVTTAPELKPKPTQKPSTTTAAPVTSSTSTTTVKPARRPKKLKAPSTTTTTTTTTSTEAPVVEVDVDENEREEIVVAPSASSSTTSTTSTTTTTTTTTPAPESSSISEHIEDDKVLLEEPSSHSVVEVASGQIKGKEAKPSSAAVDEEKLIAESTKKHTFERITPSTVSTTTSSTTVEVKTSKSVSVVTSDPLFQAVSDAELRHGKNSNVKSPETPTPAYIPSEVGSPRVVTSSPSLPRSEE